MKKLSLLALPILLASMTACGNSGGNNVLKVGMECAYAPFNWTQNDDSNGAVPIANIPNKYANGYDVQIAKAVAESMGKTLEVYSYEWDALIPAVTSGVLDAIAAGMSPTEERKQEVDFSTNYYQSNLVVVTKKTSAIADATTLADVDNASYTIAAQPGTFHADALVAQTSNCQKMTTLDFVGMQAALQAGTITGYISEEPTAMAFCTDSSDYTYVPLINNVTGFTTAEGDTAIAIATKKGSSLLAGMNEYLDTLNATDWSSLMAQMVEIAPVE